MRLGNTKRVAAGGLGAWIHFRRTQRGISVNRLASKVGVCERQIRRIESGDTLSPRFSTRMAIEKILEGRRKGARLGKEFRRATGLVVVALALCLVAARVYAVNRPSYVLSSTDLVEHTVVVEEVYDGDTFRGDDGSNYRMIGINAPEVAHPTHGKPDAEPGGDEAGEFLRALILNREVTVVQDQENLKDRYGREVALVFLEDLDVNLLMVKAGHAVVRYVNLSPMIDEDVFRARSQDPIPSGGEIDTSGESELVVVAPGVEMAGGVGVAPVAPVVAVDHLLGPGDRLHVVVGSQTEDFQVNPEGQIYIKGLGSMRVLGMTADSATVDLEQRVRARVRRAVSPISVFLLSVPPPPRPPPSKVTVFGEVRRQGTVEGSTLTQALTEAGGYTERADVSKIRVTSGETTTVVDFHNAIEGGRDFPIRSGSVIVVPAREGAYFGGSGAPKVSILGQVGRPGNYEPGTISSLLAQAGGAADDADLVHVRVMTTADALPMEIDASQILSGSVVDTTVPGGATVVVPRRSREVRVTGAVQSPGAQRHEFLSDVLSEAAPSYISDLTAVTITRGNTPRAVNGARVMAGAAEDVPLQEGDRINIPFRPPPPPPEPPPPPPAQVNVIGEVGKPGFVDEGLITEILSRAGGPTDNTTLSGVIVRFPGGRTDRINLKDVLSGHADDVWIPGRSVVYVRSSAPFRTFLSDLQSIVGMVTSLFRTTTTVTSGRGGR